MKKTVLLLVFCLACLTVCFASCSNTPADTQGCEHQYGEWMPTDPATCLEDGVEVRICAKCSYAQTQKIAAYGHTTDSGVCLRCGEEVGNGIVSPDVTEGKNPPHTPVTSTNHTPVTTVIETPVTTEGISVRDVIEIYDVYVSDINSVGGVDMGIAFTNTSDKDIKYLRFYVVPYNAVGDVMRCEIRDHSRFEAYITGPLEAGYEGYSRYGNRCWGETWSECWYNSEISYIELTGVRIEYMDGSVYTLDSKSVKEAFAEYPIDPHVEELGVQTGFTYHSDEEYYEFGLVLENRHSVSLKANVKVEVRVENQNGQTVYSNTYRVDEEDFVEVNGLFDDETVWRAGFKLYMGEIDTGSTKYGNIHYRVYSDDGQIDLEGESERVDELPVESEEETESYRSLNILGQGCYDDVMTLVTEDSGILVIDSVDYTFSGSALKVSFTGEKIGGDDKIFMYIRGTLADDGGNLVDDFSVFVSNGKVGDTFSKSFTVYTSDVGDYTLIFDGLLFDENGLLYNFRTDYQSFAAYLTEQVTENVVVPSSFLGVSVTALYRDWNSNPTITSISIPSSVVSICTSLLSQIPSLKSITVASDNPRFHSEGNCLIDTESKKLLAGCSTSVIPADGSVTVIGEGAFEGCTSLKRLTIPSSVTTIDYGAFYGCSSLESVTIPSSVTAINYSAFEECTSLKSLTIPSSVTEIGPFAFGNCRSLQSITLSEKLTVLGSAAFYGCTSLKTVTVPNGITELGVSLFDGCTALEEVHLPKTLTAIGDCAFYQCAALKLTLPNSVKTIGWRSFDGCEALWEKENGVYYVGNWAIGSDDVLYDLVLRDGTVGIGQWAFSEKAVLKTVVIPDSVKYIGYGAFFRSHGLREVSLGKGVETIGDSCFEGCDTLKKIVYNATKDAFTKVTKGEDCFGGDITLIFEDGEETISNIIAIMAESARIQWTPVSNNADTWNFSNPYIEGDTLYINCWKIVFGADLAWQEYGSSGKLVGKVARSESFILEADVTGVYSVESSSAGEAQSLVLEISLDALGTKRPDTLYLRLPAYVNGKLINVCIHFTIEW